MTSFPLPPDLLLLVLLLTYDHDSNSNHSQLGSFSLVNRSWRPLAQALLPRQIDLFRSETDERITDKINNALGQAVFRDIKTHKVKLQGIGIESLLNGAQRGRWMKIECLKYGPGRPSVIDLELISTLNNLRTLHLSDGSILPIPFEASFPHLSRLILGRNLCLAKPKHTDLDLASTMCPQSSFPALRHLSLIEFRPLCPLDQLLAPLLPQITTFAIYEPHCSSIERLLSRLESCRHLALNCRLDDFRQLVYPSSSVPVDRKSLMELESLHLKIGGLAIDEARGLLEDGEEKRSRGGRIGARQVVLYGIEESREGDGLNERIKLKPNGKIRFEDFDGE